MGAEKVDFPVLGERATKIVSNSANLDFPLEIDNLRVVGNQVRQPAGCRIQVEIKLKPATFGESPIDNLQFFAHNLNS